MKQQTARAVANLIAFLAEQQREGATVIHLGALMNHDIDNWTIGQEIDQLDRFIKAGK